MCRAGDTATLLIGAGNIDAAEFDGRRRRPLRPRPQPARRVRRRTAPLPRLPPRAPRAARRDRGVPPAHPRVRDRRRRRDQLLARHPPGRTPAAHVPVRRSGLEQEVMEPGEFQGTIGRYHWESTPWWPAAATRARRARRTSCSSCSTTSGSRSSVASAPTSTRRCSTGSRPAGCATATSTRPRCARRRVRACSPGATTTRNGMGRITDLATGFPGYDGCIPKANAFLSEILVPHGYAAWAIGKWHLTPDDELNLAARARPLAARPRLRAVLRVLRRRDAPERARARRTTTTSSTRRAPSTTATTSPRTSSTTRSSSCTTCGRSTRDKPFFAYLVPGCVSLAAPRAARVDRRATAAASTSGWDVWREQTLARQIEAGLLPPHTVLSERPEWVPAWADLTDDERRVYARYMEAFAGYLSHADHHVGRFLDALADTGDLDNTVVIVVLRQRREQRRRRARLAERRARVERRAAHRRRSAADRSTRSAARAGTTTIRGAGPSRATRRSAAGSARCTKAVSPIR